MGRYGAQVQILPSSPNKILIGGGTMEVEMRARGNMYEVWYKCCGEWFPVRGVGTSSAPQLFSFEEAQAKVKAIKDVMS